MIRTFFRPVSLSLIALMGLSGLTACSSSDDANDEPNVNPGDAVKTSFTLSVGLPNGNRSNAKPATRVSDAIAQAQSTPVFRGIDNINLIPFAGEISSSSSKLGSNITLPNAVANSLPAGQLTTTGNAKVYNDVTIPLGTNHFLFYGKAINGNNASATLDNLGGDNAFTYGTLTAAGLSDGAPSGITFTPTPIVAENAATNATATNLVNYLNSIESTTYSYTASGATEATTGSWRDYATNKDNETKPLATIYSNFITLAAGSSASVQATAQELYTSLKNLTAGEGNNLNAEEVALRDAIVKNITNSSYVTNNPTDANATLEFADNIGGYPANIYLPDGAATVKYDATSHQFQATKDNAILNDGTQVASINNYAYPANLWYFDNTDIKTSEKALSDLYQNGNSWENDILSQYESNGPVTATTRSIALTKQIQYAVGRLNATVKVAGSTLNDNKYEPVTVNDNTFTVTGFLIGGQRQVDWEFKPVTTDGATQYTLYDKAQSNNNVTVANGSTANNTLALETKEGEAVNVVVELLNNGKAFYGKNGIIPTGTKFYLVAELKPTATTVTTGQTSSTINQVFKQDFVTTATLTINANTDNSKEQGLGNAYNVIPDLRQPVLSLGMSVDLQWQNGLTFNVDM